MENEDREIILGEVEEFVDDNDSLQTTKPMVQAYDADGNLVTMNQVISYVPPFDTSGVAPFGLTKNKDWWSRKRYWRFSNGNFWLYSLLSR